MNTIIRILGLPDNVNLGDRIDVKLINVDIKASHVTYTFQYVAPTTLPHSVVETAKKIRGYDGANLIGDLLIVDALKNLQRALEEATEAFKKIDREHDDGT